MYSTLLAKQQFKIIVNLWQKQQLQLLSASLINSANISNNTNTTSSTGHKTCRNYGTTRELYKRNPTLFEASQKHKRLYSDVHRKEGKHGTQMDLTETEDETHINANEEVDAFVQNFNLKQLLYSEEDDIMKKMNSCENIEEVS